MKKPFVSIVVASYNRKYIINESIQSILSQNYPEDSFEVIVVDNNSNDGTVSEIKKIFSREIDSKKIKLLDLKLNSGSSGSYIEALKVIHEDWKYMLKMDEDVVLDKDCVAELVNEAEKSEKHTFVGGKVFYFQNKNTLHAIGADLKPYYAIAKGIGVNVSGAFSEYICIPESNIIKIPNDIEDKIAALFDPLGNAFHTALSFGVVGEDVLITGAGPIGIMAAKICQSIGARKVILTDVNEERINLAKKLKIKLIYNTKQKSFESIINENNMKEGFDVGLEMSGSNKALNDMIKVMNYGGKIAALGIASTALEVNWNEIVFKMLKIKGITGREMFETWYKMIAMIQGGLNFENIITHEFHYTDFQKAFKIMKQGQCGKIILDWS